MVYAEGVRLIPTRIATKEVVMNFFDFHLRLSFREMARLRPFECTTVSSFPTHQEKYTFLDSRVLTGALLPFWFSKPVE